MSKSKSEYIFIILRELQLRELDTIIIYGSVDTEQQDINSNRRIHILY